VETALRRWVQLTGQDQEWSLFAPTVSRATGFPAVLLSWQEALAADGRMEGAQLTFRPPRGFHLDIERDAPRTAVLLSANEPANLDHYFRWSKCRLRRYEWQFYLIPHPLDNESPTEAAQRLNRRVNNVVKEYHDAIVAYLRWRLGQWQRDHAAEPDPRLVVLLLRVYRIHGPDEPRGWDEPTVIPLARWLPKRPHPENAYVLDSYDFSEKRFVALNR
jgi:hypothetical protein